MKYFIGHIPNYGWVLLQGENKNKLCKYLTQCMTAYKEKWTIKKFNLHFTESKCEGNINSIKDTGWWIMQKDKRTGEWV